MRILATLIVLLAAWLPCSGAAEGPAGLALGVQLRPAAAAAGKFVRLDEVAELSGERAGEAGSVLLGLAPAAGQRRTVTGQAVAGRLAEEGFECALTGASETVVLGPGQAPDQKPAQAPPAAGPAAPVEESLTSLALVAVRASLAGHLGRPADDVEVKLEPLRAVGLPSESKGLTCQVRWPAGNPRLGRQRVEVAFSSGKEPAGCLEACADAAVWGPVLEAARNLAAGELLRPEDVRAARRRLAGSEADHLTSPAQLAGMVPVRAIRAGAVLETRDLAKQLLVRRGQAVTLVIESGSVRLSEAAVARSNGGLGDMVTVERPGSRRQLAGRVVDHGKVRME